MLSVIKIVLGIAFMLGVSKSQDLNSRYSQLFNYPNKQAARQRLILRNELQRKTKALRKRRGVGGLESPTNASTATPYKQSLDSYVCDNHLHVNETNGYKTTGLGLYLNVTIFKEGGEWIANVSWNRPKEGNDKCIGYRIFWYKPKTGFFVKDYCDKIINENITWYIIDSSKGWKDLELLEVAVFPLPSRSKNWKILLRRFQRPTVAASLETSTTSQPTKDITINPASSPNGTKTDNTTMSSPSKNFIVESTTSLSKFAVATVAVGVGIVAVAISLVVWWVKRKKGEGGGIHDETTNYTYISYYSDNDKITKAAIRIASWLKQQNLNVIIDKFDVITDGMRKWCDRHISSAKKVIIIISPGYLKISKLDENFNPVREQPFSFKDQLAYNNVCHIHDEIMKMPLTTQRFVVILVETGYDELPFWMKRLNVYKYSGGKVDENILEVLNA